MKTRKRLDGALEAMMFKFEAGTMKDGDEKSEASANAAFLATLAIGFFLASALLLFTGFHFWGVIMLVGGISLRP